MSRQLEAKIEQRAAKLQDAAMLAIYGGLDDAVSYAGGELAGFSVRLGVDECLMTLRAEFPGGRMVSFVGGEGLPEVFVKASREARGDKLKWRADGYGDK